MRSPLSNVNGIRAPGGEARGRIAHFDQQARALQVARLLERAEHPSRHLDAVHVEHRLGRQRPHDMSAGQVGAHQRRMSGRHRVQELAAEFNALPGQGPPVLSEAQCGQAGIGAGLGILRLCRFEHLERRAGAAPVKLVQAGELGRGGALLRGRYGNLAVVGHQQSAVEHGAERIDAFRRLGRDWMGDPQADRALLFCIERGHGVLSARMGRIILVSPGGERHGERRIHCEVQRAPDPDIHDRDPHPGGNGKFT